VKMWSQLLIALIVCEVTRSQTCPDDDADLVPWTPTTTEDDDYVIDGEKLLLVGETFNVRRLTIQNGGKLVVSDDGLARVIRARNILITSNGEFWVGSQSCPFQSRLDIALTGRNDDTDIGEAAIFGRKYIGVAPTATIVIHGKKKLSWTFIETTIEPGTSSRVVSLVDEPTGWKVGDQVVVASSDYDMYQAEEFTIAECQTCGNRQVQLDGDALYTHLGSGSPHGIDTRAEIGILTQDIKIYGVMQDSCYGDNFCEYFDYDTYGGHIQMLSGFKQADFFGIELYNMGQQVLARYPVHYHVVGKIYGSYSSSLSIHHCFSRCVTLHGCEGLVVSDVVGYDTLGHCFFFEDGNEQDNQLIHNLGLLTKPGTLLPSDRSKEMCETMLDAVYPGYVPNAELECMSASTYWIAHPNNTFRNNSAAGSVSNGFHFVFHREPTGPSAGTLPEFHGERSTIPWFQGNRAHSNARDGLLIDRGVKVDSANVVDPREFLAMEDYARYMPHVDRDPLAERDPAVVNEFTAYKNNRGANIRGGDVWITYSKFTDNDVAVMMNSDDMLPYDAGSHQQLSGSVVAATGNNADPTWQARDYPSVGVELRGGPVYINSNHFHGFKAAGGRESYGVGFYPQNMGQLGTTNTVSGNSFNETNLRVYFGRADPDSIFGSYNSDGDYFQIFYDPEGDLTGWPNAYAVRLDNMLMRGSNCFIIETSNIAVCIGDNYGQIFIKANTKTANMIIEYPTEPYYSVTLRGVNRDDTVHYPDTTQYQVTVITDRDYHISFTDETTPSVLELSVYNFPRFNYAVLAISYPSSTGDFTVEYVEWQQMSGEETLRQTLTAADNIDDVYNDAYGYTYYWNDADSLLWVKVVNRYESNGYDYCAAEGCQIVRIVAN